MSSTTIRLFWRYALIATLRRRGAQLIQIPQNLKGANMQAQNMPSTPATIALVDFSNILRRHFEVLAKDGNLDEVDQSALNQLSEIRQMCEAVVVCLDSPPYLRKQVYPEYKAHRDRKPEYEIIAARVRERLKKDGYQIARSPGHEADDVIATLAREYPDYGCNDVRVFGNDKDACQLVSDVVRIFVPKGRGEYEIRDAAWVKQKYGVEPRDMALFQAICGDKSDGIPGIAGIGDKGAAKLITQFKDPAGMATACTRAVEESQKEGAKPLAAFWRNYAAGMASLPKWIQLTTLNTRCETERSPLDYLERLEPQPLVEEDDLGDDPTDEVDWEFIAEQTDEQQRSEMAAALPVGKPLVAEPMPDGPARRARQAAEADRIMPLTPKAAPSGESPAATAPAGAPHDPSKMVIGKDPKAEEALRKLASTAPPAPAQTTSPSTDAAPSGAGAASPPPAATQPAPAPSSSSAQASTQPANENVGHVVPPSQGPPKRGDIIRSPEVTDIAIVQPPSWALATQPRTAKEMLDIAAVLYNSRFYSQFGNYRGVYSVMSLGRELGMGYAESLEAFHIVKEKPYPKAKWILSRCQKHPDFEWFIVAESTAERAVIKAKHKRLSEVLVFEYTIQEAEQQGHTTGPNRDNWKKSPRSMLRARAITGAAGEWCPGAAYAMPSAEEAEDYEDARR